MFLWQKGLQLLTVDLWRSLRLGGGKMKRGRFEVLAGGRGPPSPMHPLPQKPQHPVGRELVAWLDLLSGEGQAGQKGCCDSCLCPLTTLQASAKPGGPGKLGDRKKNDSHKRSRPLWKTFSGPHSNSETQNPISGGPPSCVEGWRKQEEKCSGAQTRASLCSNGCSHLPVPGLC